MCFQRKARFGRDKIEVDIEEAWEWKTVRTNWAINITNIELGRQYIKRWEGNRNIKKE